MNNFNTFLYFRTFFQISTSIFIFNSWSLWSFIRWPLNCSSILLVLFILNRDNLFNRTNFRLFKLIFNLLFELLFDCLYLWFFDWLLYWLFYLLFFILSYSFWNVLTKIIKLYFWFILMLLYWLNWYWINIFHDFRIVIIIFPCLLFEIVRLLNFNSL
jgi:hypothetical protein